MKTKSLPVAIFSLLLGQAAMADQAVPDARALGITEAVVSYCSKVDPKATAHYQERIRLLANGASEEQLARLRQSDEYQKAHASVDDFVAKVDEHNARKVCAESPQRNK
jgi:hypothetical protein